MNSWQNTINFSQDILVLVALLGAVWSAYQFSKQVTENRERRRQQQLEDWRKSSVHLMLHSSSKFMNLKSILEKLRSGSFDTGFEINKNELTEDVVRMLVLKMLQDGQIQQLWGDQYGIQSNGGIFAEVEFVRALTNNFAIKAFEQIYGQSGELSTDTLYKLVDGESMISKSNFAAALQILVKEQLADLSKQGKWQVVAKVQEARGGETTHV